MADDEESKSGRGLGGWALLALAGLARSCDDVGRVAVIHLDDLSPAAQYVDDLGKPLAMSTDDALRSLGPQADELLRYRYQPDPAARLGEEARASLEIPEVAPEGVGDDLGHAATRVGEEALEQLIVSDGEENPEGERQ